MTTSPARMPATGWIMLLLLMAALVVAFAWGGPIYNVWKRQKAGQAELAYQQGARQALIAQAAAEDEASIKRAEAATRRVKGWALAAKQGCEILGRPGDRACEETLIHEAAVYSIAKEGHEGVIVSVGAPAAVAVQPNIPRAN